MKKRLVSFLLAGSFLLTPAMAFAVEEPAAAAEQSPRYAYISMIARGLTISSSGQASCTANVELYPGYKADVTMNLQKQVGESSWSTVKTWTGSGSGALGIDLYGTYWVSKGTYVVEVIVEVKDSNNRVIETQTSYSTMKTYK